MKINIFSKFLFGFVALNMIMASMHIRANPINNAMLSLTAGFEKIASTTTETGTKTIESIGNLYPNTALRDIKVISCASALFGSIILAKTLWDELGNKKTKQNKILMRAGLWAFCPAVILCACRAY